MIHGIAALFLFRFTGCSASCTKGAGGDVNVNDKRGDFSSVLKKNDIHLRARKWLLMTGQKGLVKCRRAPVALLVQMDLIGKEI